MGIKSGLLLILLLLIFILLSEFIFYKTEYAKWIYAIFLISLTLKLCETKRNDILISTFSSKDYVSIRIIENNALAIPFIIYLFINAEILIAAILLPMAVLLAFYRNKNLISKTIFTPFKRYPFEFIVGFRKTFWVFGLAYFLIYKAIVVDNYNLGLFGLLLIFLTCMYYYQKVEHEYFVWIFSSGTKEFLWGKLVASIICVTILSILALIGMLICFSQNWLITIMVYLVGYVFLGSMILAKYSAYPYEMNLPQGIFYAFSLFLPPLLIISILIFYAQSKRKLDPILEC